MENVQTYMQPKENKNIKITGLPQSGFHSLSFGVTVTEYRRWSASKEKGFIQFTVLTVQEQGISIGSGEVIGSNGTLW